VATVVTPAIVLLTNVALPASRSATTDASSPSISDSTFALGILIVVVVAKLVFANAVVVAVVTATVVRVAAVVVLVITVVKVVVLVITVVKVVAWWQ
jgi:hypothetical protein